MSNSLLTVEAVCNRFGVDPLPCHPQEKVGIALRTLHLHPLNALRLQPSNGTCGWYIWGGEALSTDPEFFQPLHVSHMREYAADLIPYLGLGVGWRVLLAPNYEDVWFDEALMQNAS